MSTNRRQFMKVSAISVAALAGARVAYAQPMVADTDPQAIALGYKPDTADVDTAKFPKHQADQHCANCQLYTAKDDDTGTCTIFPGKLVASNGWCNLWVKRP